MASPAIQRFLTQLREQRARGQAVAAIPPDVKAPQRQPLYNALRRGATPPGVPVVHQDEPPPQVSLEAVQERLLHEITSYAQGDGEHVLLLRVPPGVGKSYAACQALQDLSGDGRKLYTAARKDFWGNDLTRFPIFKPDLWWNWLAISAGNEKTGEPMTCRVAEAMGEWLRRGYPGIELCRQLCFQDRWIGNCPYRQQARRKEPAIFARHNHLVFGLSFDDLDLAVVDELPLSAFLRDQFVPKAAIVPGGTVGPVTELFKWLEFLVDDKQYRSSKDLLDVIGECLGDVYAQVEVQPEALPDIPVVSGPEDVSALPYNYWSELLLTLAPEYECWCQGWNHWVPRVKVRPGGLRLLGRHKVWERLPTKVVMLDATGDERIARAIFERPVKVVECSVEMRGRIFQVVGRLNGISQVRDKEARSISPQGKQMLASARLIVDEMGYDDIGIITFKKLLADFELEFGAGNVLHYGAQRGTNVFAGKEAVILCGAPNWPLLAIADVAAMLFPKRMKSFTRDEQGEWVYPWRSAPAEYRLKDGSQAWRYHRGFWSDAELRTVMEASRVAEVMQGAHRARPVLYPADVWILTSIPTPLPLDGVYQDLSELWFTPDRDTDASTGVSWLAWLKLRPWLAEKWEAAARSETETWLTAQDLADAVGAHVSTVRRQKWLSSIASYSERWHLESRQIGMGRPRLGILAVES